MATVLAKFQETQRQQEEQYLGFREELRSINSTLGTIVGVLKELLNTRRDTVAQQGAPVLTWMLNCPPLPLALVDRRHRHRTTSTPPPAEGEPPRKRSLRSRTKTENDAKIPAKKLDHPDCHPFVPPCHSVHT
ncbi:hypothetical protein NDU88_006654 [Pleurodeles waltl]|uniref:Uncharacterized protein n=1 Tax=Pleurodeles waltl TaxID=8319 RepID=A0AAV7MDV5_PLEWA|nr:hypothetical protein NDU88_006654 [Pleurodeles waltl]